MSTSTSETAIDTTAVPTITSGYRLQYEDAQSCWVLLYPEGMIKLNQSAAEILKRCDGDRTVDEVIAQLENDFEQTGLSKDIQGFLAVAREQRWIELRDA